MVKVSEYREHEIHLDSRGRLQAIRRGRVAAEADTMDGIKRAIDALFMPASQGVKDDP